MYLLIIIYGYVLIAGLLIYFFIRDRKQPQLFFGRHRLLSAVVIIVLAFGIAVAFYSTLVEPFWLRTTHLSIHSPKFRQNLRIAFVTDMQVGKYKKTGWVEKIVEKIEAAKPDLVIFGGDLIDNEGTFEDESKYLEPLKKLVGQYPVYYILGNHEYGIGGNVRFVPVKYTGDRSQLLIDRMNSFNISLLSNTLECPNIKGRVVCLFGMDEIWKRPPNFSQLEKLDRKTPLILISHNPDGILYYQNNLPAPDLVLSGHTHGGQIWIPFFGPLGDAETQLDVSYYRGLNYYNGTPIYTSVGAGESGAPLRLFAVPEVAIIEFTP